MRRCHTPAAGHSRLEPGNSGQVSEAVKLHDAILSERAQADVEPTDYAREGVSPLSKPLNVDSAGENQVPWYYNHTIGAHVPLATASRYRLLRGSHHQSRRVIQQLPEWD